MFEKKTKSNSRISLKGTYKENQKRYEVETLNKHVEPPSASAQKIWATYLNYFTLY